MAERTIPNIPKYRGEDPDLGVILDRLREAVEGMVEIDFVTEKDIYCKDLITSENSIYIGSKKPENKLSLEQQTLVVSGAAVSTQIYVQAYVAENGMRGNAVFVSATEPSNPQTNDIWIHI